MIVHFLPVILFSHAYVRLKKTIELFIIPLILVVESFLFCKIIKKIPCELKWDSRAHQMQLYVLHENKRNVFFNQSEWIMMMGFSATQSGLPAPATPIWFHLSSQTKKCFPPSHWTILFHMFNLAKLQSSSKSIACLRNVYQLSGLP